MKRLIPALAMAVLMGLAAKAWADELHVEDGRVLKGKVVRQTEVLVEFRTNEGKTLSFPMTRVHKVVRDGGGSTGSRGGDGHAPPPVDPHDGDDDTPPPVTGGHDDDDPAPNSSEPAGRTIRSQREIEDLISKVGRTPPDWWDSVKLDFPQSLDLSWPDKPPPGWNANQNMGQYLWDVINPNENRWQSGAKLMSHVMSVNKDDKRIVRKAMGSMAHIYGDLLQDHARAAFWLLAAGRVSPLNVNENAKLAECYYRLGSKQMAAATLNKSRTFTVAVVKLWSEMGEQSKALRMAAMFEKSQPDQAYIMAGDIHRRYGNVSEAIRCYERVVSLSSGNKNMDRSRKRAQASLDATKLFDGLNLSKVPDGQYVADSLGYVGPVQVTVTVRNGRIEKAEVTDHHEKQFYSSISETTGQIVAKQSVKGIDTTAGATITSEAIINATAKALNKGMK